MPSLHRPFAVPHQRDQSAGLNHAVTPPPQLPCDTCGGPVSRYNPTGRCNACGLRDGWDDQESEIAAIPVDKARLDPALAGHAPGCECQQRQYQNATRVDTRYSGKSRIRIVYVIDVECPDCGDARPVRTDGLRGLFLCRTNYRRRCRPCGIAAAKTRRGGYHQVDE